MAGLHAGMSPLRNIGHSSFGPWPLLGHVQNPAGLAGKQPAMPYQQFYAELGTLVLAIVLACWLAPVAWIVPAALWLGAFASSRAGIHWLLARLKRGRAGSLPVVITGCDTGI